MENLTEWAVERACSTAEDYEMIIERNKRSWECDTKTQSWKWYIVYSGAVVSQGFADHMNKAKESAESALPENVIEKIKAGK